MSTTAHASPFTIAELTAMWEADTLDAWMEDPDVPINHKLHAQQLIRRQALRDARKVTGALAAMEQRDQSERLAEQEATLRRRLALKQAERARARAARMAQRETDAVVMLGRMCSECDRRPAVFDDLCKRCAHAKGTRPTGKV